MSKDNLVKASELLHDVYALVDHMEYQYQHDQDLEFDQWTTLRNTINTILGFIDDEGEDNVKRQLSQSL